MFPKEINSKNCKKIINFPILLKETQPTIFRPVGVFNALGVAFFRVTLHDREQTLFFILCEVSYSGS